MNIIKNVFSIKDLENLSGIKAHTIRIWEKRYGLLEPMRTETNIRHYDIENLQKLLNVTLLYNNNYKISKIAQFSPEKIAELVKQTATRENHLSHVLSNFKLAMMNFDEILFHKTYKDLEKNNDFSAIFFEALIPLLHEIGILWQTDTITPAHEHFISYLIKQKLLVNIEKIQSLPQKNEGTYVLFLPPNEIHELGLLYLNYEILRNGYKTIFLGPSIPIECLTDIKKRFNNITFVTYITVEPSPDAINDYLKEFEISLLTQDQSKLWVFLKSSEYIEEHRLSKSIKTFSKITDIRSELI
ncbi:MerR family transcriptional regulator [Flavobacterium sp. SM15]|uniref:MerR family transcriptional regulator n=1 Tax=Flavobacterium sp. SM15 TaxID=2908005 RepID=UPI001EDB0EA2|nr:MerR family transcriptional regulator [Flavobacterium sp. SM15]MCG2610461.1 MerR family transcriptional regulator [Flavobacterium sp. SM15]